MFDDKPVISPAIDVAAMIEAYELSRCQGCEPAALSMDLDPVMQAKARYAMAVQRDPIDWDNVFNPSCDLSPLHAEAVLRAARSE